MQIEFEEEIREFLIESNENLTMLDQQIVELEQDPENHGLISSIFRTIHSIKGTCGFFGFDSLGAITHLTESILTQLREEHRPLTPELISLILEAVDAVKLLLTRIEATGGEGADDTDDLRRRLDMACRLGIDGDALHAGSVPAPFEATIPHVHKTFADPRTTDRPGSVAEASTELHITDSTIRVDVTLLDDLMTLVGELVLTRNQLLQAAGGLSLAAQQTSQRLNSITTELQEGVMKTRMQPIGVIWNKLPRVVRDLSSKCGKQIHIEMVGAETELDRSLIEAIRDPLMHIVRNACDHGIESPAERQRAGKPPTGTLSLRAFHEAGTIHIEISDDGAGIDADKVLFKALEKRLITSDQAAAMSRNDAVNLIFLPGFSTTDQITRLSGRGVGMDVVKTNIEKISGSVEVAVQPAGGTVIKIKIPLTLAIIPGLIVSASIRPGQGPGCEDRFVIPQSNLIEMTRVNMTADPSVVETVHGATVFRHRGKLVPLLYLNRVLKLAEVDPADGLLNIIILERARRQFGLVVDRICDTQEIVVKPLGEQLKHLDCYGGATIMGDGQPALILDVGGLAKMAGLDTQAQETVPPSVQTKSSEITSEMLLFRAGVHRRLALPVSIVNRLEEVSVERVEVAAGQLVVSYCGELMPIFPVASFLEETWLTADLPTSGNLHVIVIINGDRRFGLIVDEIIDIVVCVIDIMRSSSDPAIIGSAVIGGAVTDLLDMAGIMEKATGNCWSRLEGTNLHTRRVLCYDMWSISREMTRTLLSSAGYLYSHAASAAEARGILDAGPVDALIVSDRNEIPAWWTELRSHDSRLACLPQIVLKNTREEAEMADKVQDKLNIPVDRHDRAELLRTIARVTRPEAGKKAA